MEIYSLPWGCVSPQSLRFQEWGHIQDVGMTFQCPLWYHHFLLLLLEMWGHPDILGTLRVMFFNELRIIINEGIPFREVQYKENIFCFSFILSHIFRIWLAFSRHIREVYSSLDLLFSFATPNILYFTIGIGRCSDYSTQYLVYKI